MKKRIVKFIEANGWVFNGSDGEHESFIKHRCYDIDINDSEFVLIDETGDFSHVQLNAQSHYTLLGLLIHYNQITMGYNYPA